MHYFLKNEKFLVSLLLINACSFLFSVENGTLSSPLGIVRVLEEYYKLSGVKYDKLEFNKGFNDRKIYLGNLYGYYLASNEISGAKGIDVLMKNMPLLSINSTGDVSGVSIQKNEESQTIKATIVQKIILNKFYEATPATIRYKGQEVAAIRLLSSRAIRSTDTSSILEKTISVYHVVHQHSLIKIVKMLLPKLSSSGDQIVPQTPDEIYFALKYKSAKSVPYFEKNPRDYEIGNEIKSLMSLRGRTEHYEPYKSVIIPVIDGLKESLVLPLFGIGLGREPKPSYVLNSAQQTVSVQIPSMEASDLSNLPTSSSDLIFDQPFLMWIKYSSLVPNIFEGYITDDYWKKPSTESTSLTISAPGYVAEPSIPLTQKGDRTESSSGAVSAATPQDREELFAAPFGIMRAIDECFRFAGVPESKILLLPNNFIQTQYLPYLKQGNRRLTAFRNGELITQVSNDTNVLNQLLQRHGFSIQLQPIDPANGIGVVVIQNLLIDWLDKGAVSVINRYEQVHTTYKSYPAVRLKDSGLNLRFYETPQGNGWVKIIGLKSKSQDWVYLASRPDKPYFDRIPTEKELSQEVSQLRTYVKQAKQTGATDYLRFPMIDFQKEKTLDTLIGMAFGDYVVNQALQEVIFKMDEIGAQVKVAVAAGAMRGHAPIKQETEYIIKNPFLVWVVREGIEPTVFEGYMTTEYWKRPDIQR